MRSLRFRLAVTGFLTAYAPTLVLLALGAYLSGEVTTELADVVVDGEVLSQEFTESSTGVPLSILVVISIASAPFAALFAWWWSGRAVRPIAEAVALQERLIEETSHELRTPLAVLTNNAQVLLQHPEPTVDIYRQGLERSEAVANRISQTIDTLLVDARGRARTIDRVPADLVAITGSVLQSLSGLAEERRVRLDLVGNGLGGNKVEAKVDRDSIERAISNLITNAIQHAPADTAVSIEINRVGDMAEILITDEGAGIPAEHQAKIFERYWQAAGDINSDPNSSDTNSRGSGIGLAIVRQVAIAHGGEVTVTSPVDGRPGARFRLAVRTG